MIHPDGFLQQGALLRKEDGYCPKDLPTSTEAQFSRLTRRTNKFGSSFATVADFWSVVKVMRPCMADYVPIMGADVNTPGPIPPQRQVTPANLMNREEARFARDAVLILEELSDLQKTNFDKRQTNAFWLTWSQEQVLIGIACLPPDPRSENEAYDDGELRHKLVMLGARAENFHSMARITLRHEEILCWAILRALDTTLYNAHG